MDYLLGGLLGGIGAGILFLLKHYVTRDSNRRDRRDQKQEEIATVHVTNQGKQIDADQAAFVIVTDRLKLVESRIDKLQEDLTLTREMSAKKDARIEHLQADNKELRAEVDKLRTDRREQDKTIAALRRELDALKVLVATNGLQDSKGTIEDPIHVKVENE